ncbi:flagellar rod assembly protein/muramidase FlgJ [Pseudomonas sp. BAY1663]|nr:flagellar rod assembly protein/muramidase FlgJ [Pseudomonas sp. BAY1663]
MDNRLASGRRALDSGSYTDLNRLNQLKVGKDRDGEENVRKVAQEFESLFLNEMLKSMRSATEVLAKDNPLNSQASKQYQDMYDQQLSVSLSKEGGGIGLADVLVRQLSKQTEAVTRSNPFAQVAQTEARPGRASRRRPSSPCATIRACSTSGAWRCRAGRASGSWRTSRRPIRHAAPIRHSRW